MSVLRLSVCPRKSMKENYFSLELPCIQWSSIFAFLHNKFL